MSIRHSPENDGNFQIIALLVSSCARLGLSKCSATCRYIASVRTLSTRQTVSWGGDILYLGGENTNQVHTDKRLRLVVVSTLLL